MKSKKIQIVINGDTKLINFNQSLIDLLNILHIKNNAIAVEINREVIPKSLYSSTILKENDIIEILQFIGGG